MTPHTLLLSSPSLFQAVTQLCVTSGAHAFPLLMSPDTVHISHNHSKATQLLSSRRSDAAPHSRTLEALWSISQTQEEATCNLQAQILYAASEYTSLSE